MTKRPTRQPDYRRFVQTLRLHEPDAVPIAELGIDPAAKARLLGRAVTDVRSDVEFWYRAVYDFVSLRPAYEFPHTMPGSANTGRPRYGDEGVEQRTMGVMAPGVSPSATRSGSTRTFTPSSLRADLTPPGRSTTCPSMIPLAWPSACDGAPSDFS